MLVEWVAQVYGVKPATVRKWIQRGKIPRITHHIPCAELEQWMAERDTRMDPTKNVKPSVVASFTQVV